MALVRFTLRFVLIVLGVLVPFAVGLIIAPELDERIGFFTMHAVEAVQSYKVDGAPLRSIIEARFNAVRWRAYHQDIPMQTFVECVGTPRSGGAERHMLWYVDERPTWSNGLSLKISIMTALNRDALQMTPHLFDPHAGFGLDQWRRGVELP